ncbi:ABC transporter B family member 9, partial [Capsicum baccatum]
MMAYAFTVKQGLVSGIGLGVVLLILLSTYGLAIWYGSKLIIEKGYHGGDVINVLMAIMTGGMSLGQTTPSLNAFAAGQAAAYKMFETINKKPLVDTSDMSGVVLADIDGEIELKDVYFRYPSRLDVQIFSGFSLVVPSGKTVALVGQSGSGRSTIISLLERFYDPEAGDVLLDGINLKKYQLKWLRQQMGLVSQEPILFATTIKENISCGKENATEEEISAAIEIANAANFIEQLPQGLDTKVGEHGTQLSDGQKQRLAIARAILKNPKILLLDEATSALDAESERIVQEALEKVMEKRTIVVVAHRLTTIRNADYIAVLHAGKLLEQAIGVSQSTTIAPNVNKAKDSIASIFGILDIKPKIDSSFDVGTTLVVVRGDIEFKHVSYRYATRPDVQIFKDLCLTIPSGKNQYYLTRQFVITLPTADKGKQQKKRSFKQQNQQIHNFISSLPQGYDTSVGERGIQLLGGRKQRIAIARPILKDPKILLLDEETSALDAESEHIVQDALDRIM